MPQLFMWTFLALSVALGGAGARAQPATGVHVCGSHVTINPSTATDTNLVAPVAGKTVLICDYNFSVNGAQSLYLEGNTSGGTCGGTLAQIDTEWYMPSNGAKTDANAFYRGLSTTIGSGVCLHTTQAVAMSFTLYYDQE